MTRIRVVTYNVQGCRGRDGRTDSGRTLAVLRSLNPDIVALQDLAPEAASSQLAELAGGLGLKAYGPNPSGRQAFLSRFPLKGLRPYGQADQVWCLRADADVHGKRLHLLNLRLACRLGLRLQQISSLLGPDLLADRALVCPTLVLGDFADYCGGLGSFSLNLALRQAPRPLWAGTYPAAFPLLGRDRAYLRGELEVLAAEIARSAQARQASSHLPFLLTIKLQDPRNYLRLDKVSGGRMEIAPG